MSTFVYPKKQPRNVGKMRYVAFDIEIATTIPDAADDWSRYRPFGISCAATILRSGDEETVRLWKGFRQPLEEYYPEQMRPHEVINLVRYLNEKRRDGYQIVSWNGLGFDLDVIAEEVKAAEIRERVIDLALNHIDPAFHMFCVKGYMIGLQAAAEGCGFEGKLQEDGVEGARAAEFWAGTPEQQDLVLRYVEQDARMTADVYRYLMEYGELPWTSRRGKANTWRFDELLMPLQAMELPEPDTSWMTREPWTREKFIGWTHVPLADDSLADGDVAPY